MGGGSLGSGVLCEASCPEHPHCAFPGDPSDQPSWTLTAALCFQGSEIMSYSRD